MMAVFKFLTRVVIIFVPKFRRNVSSRRMDWAMFCIYVEKKITHPEEGERKFSPKRGLKQISLQYEGPKYG
jgi:hypothetical protein